MKNKETRYKSQTNTEETRYKNNIQLKKIVLQTKRKEG
jgi:hypothetical protein